MITLFTWIILINLFVPTEASGCCARVTNEACKRSCQQLQGLPSAVPPMQFLLTAAETCPPHFTDFWNCINNSLLAVQQMAEWPGKPCCDMARSKECRKHCTNANTKDNIFGYCREKDEPTMYSCITNQEEGSSCCGKAKSISCSLVCHGIYLTGVRNTKATRDTLNQHCRRKGDKRVAQCVNRKWRPPDGNHIHDMPCCDVSTEPSCRSRCREILSTVMSEDDPVDELSKACSVPQVTDPFWQCFLMKQESRKNETAPVTRFDNAKLQCCGKAASGRCRNLCTQTYKKGWTYGAEFETSCSYLQPVSTMEAKMHSCLIDVEQPCKLGCSGLHFCSNFNNRPTEAFRSCSPESDKAAALAYESWKDGVIHLPQLNIFVKDITQCKPYMWQAIACALEIQPCSSTQSVMTLCKEDCMYILTSCVDQTKLSGEQTVPVLCNALPSKTIPGSCVPLDPYLTKSPTTVRQREITHPCNPNPCMPNEICLLRRRKCKHPTNCLPYICHGACPLGQVSKVLVPKGTALRLINVNTDASKGEDCYLACQCGHHGKIENCKPMHCLKRQSCKLSIDNVKEHGDQFTLDRRQCVCNVGEIICSQTSCRLDMISPLYTGMHGNCPMHYNPVCGTNGRTYPNRCIAKCAGVSTVLANSACSDVDMCAVKPCPTGHRCVPKPQVCLNDLAGSGSCRQYQCVEEIGECNVHHHDPVCDSHGNEFNNICILYSRRKTFGYRGHCQGSCSPMGVVCGHDGETYSSECAAKAARVTVDYHSRCQAFGNLTGNYENNMSCNQILCPPVYPRNCLGIIPPGGCCPICAAQMTLLMDPRLLQAAIPHINSGVLSSMDVLNSLSSHMTLLECDIFGYVSINSELIVIVAPTVLQPSTLQAEACQSEAKRIYNLIRSGSPNVLSYLNLSPLLVVSIETSTIKHPVVSDSTYLTSSENQESSVSSRTGNSASKLTIASFTVWFYLLTWLTMHRTYTLRL